MIKKDKFLRFEVCDFCCDSRKITASTLNGIGLLYGDHDKYIIMWCDKCKETIEGLKK